MSPSSLAADSLLEYTRITASTLQDISHTKNIPFLNAISQTTMVVISMVQTAKANRDRCLRMMDEIHQLLCVLAKLGSESTLTPKFLDDVGRLAQNLYKFSACLRSQQELGKIRRFFKQSEITAQLVACEVELQGLLESFKLHSGPVFITALVELGTQLEERHQEFMELLASESQSQYSSDTVSVLRSVSQTNSSSGTFSLVPAQPHIFYGRESELEDTVACLVQTPARAVVLGAGGMGKTTLALAALHHPDVEEKYPHQYFISCDSATSSTELISIIGVYLGLEPSRQLSRIISGYFHDRGPAILVLDNLETSWEPLSTRIEVEEFLSSLADVPHLALLITMRGAERPGKVKWSRPFLPPLEPISTLASHQMFVDIAEEPRTEEKDALAELIELTGNLPLAVVLMANVASFEGYLGTLSRWKAESTALLSEGYDRRSNLEKSVIMSLTSPRIQSNPHALELLSLISILPDGISEGELKASRVPLQKISQCRSALLQTSLAFLTDGRLKALPPIREYVRGSHPPCAALTRPLVNHFLGLLKVWESYYGLSLRDLLPPLTSNLGNIQSLLLNELITEGRAQSEIGYGVVTLSQLSLTMLKGESGLIQYLSEIIDSSHDQCLKWLYLQYRIQTASRHIVTPEDVDSLVNQGIQYYVAANDYEGQAGAYIAISQYHKMTGDLGKSLEISKLGVALANKISPQCHIRGLHHKAHIERILGDYHESIRHFQEAQKLARIIGGVTAEWDGVIGEAAAWCRLGNLTKAQACAAEGRKLLLQIGLQESAGELYCLDQMAEIHFQKTEYMQSRHFMELLLQRISRHSSPYYYTNCLATLAQIDIITGAEETGIIEKLAAARKSATEIGWHRAQVICDINQCQFDLRKGDQMGAYTTLTSVARTPGTHADLIHASLGSLGDLSNGMSSVADTFYWAMTYLAFAKKTKALGHIYQALRYLGDIFLAEGDEQSALNIFQAVLSGSTEMDVHQRRADCMSRMGDIFLRCEETNRAKEVWDAARPLFVCSSQANDVAAIDAKLAKLGRDNIETHLAAEGDETAAPMDREIAEITPAEAGATGGDAAVGITKKLSNLPAPVGLLLSELQEADASGSVSLKKENVSGL
ncbi:hypothetical protein B0H14DRAFT_2717939 [Mycena olivaceomarginata]|nr:hypothetical protein B0H14DRAFT_2717939 [Mycena olivaceomarginata]